MRKDWIARQGYLDVLRLMLMSEEEKEADYKLRVVGRIEAEENNGIGVSTCWVGDLECYETALLTADGAKTVQRYDTVEKARKGHPKWVKFAKTANGKKVRHLGLPDLLSDETIQLRGVK